MKITTEVDNPTIDEVVHYYFSERATLTAAIEELYENHGMRAVEIAERLDEPTVTICVVVRRLRLKGRVTRRNGRRRKSDAAVAC